MNNVDSAWALLRGEIDADQYWRESGANQVESAGVLLTQQQQDRALRNLARLAVNLRQVQFELLPEGSDSKLPGSEACIDDLARSFATCLAACKP